MGVNKLNVIFLGLSALQQLYRDMDEPLHDLQENDDNTNISDRPDTINNNAIPNPW